MDRDPDNLGESSAQAANACDEIVTGLQRPATAERAARDSAGEPATSRVPSIALAHARSRYCRVRHSLDLPTIHSDHSLS